MKVLKLKNRRWGDIERHLMLTVGDMVTMAGDEATGQVIVQGPPEQIELTGRLVRQLDQPQRTVKLTFDFLLVGYDPHFEAVEGNAPPRVSRVWEALEETGARQMTYLGSAVVQSAESEEFATEGVQGAVEPGFRYEIEGQVNFMEPEDTVRIRVEAEAVRVQHGSKQASGWEHGFQVESTLTAKMGEAVVLASAPAGEQTGPGSVVIVVQADWPDRSEPSP